MASARLFLGQSQEVIARHDNRQVERHLELSKDFECPKIDAEAGGVKVRPICAVDVDLLKCLDYPRGSAAPLPYPRYSDEDDLRQVIEVLVACVQNQVVLQHERGDPHVVGRNRRSLFPKLAEN